MNIIVTNSELIRCEKLAVERDAQNRNLQNHRGYIPDRNDSKTQVFSYVAELAIAKALGVEFQGQVGDYQRPDLLVTGKMGNLISIDVKSSIKGTPYLCIPTGHLKAANYFAYVTGSNFNVHVVGYIKASDVNQFPLKDFGNRGAFCYAIPVESLKPFPTRNNG